MQKYYCEGMKFYGEKIPLAKYIYMNEPTIFLGLYFEEDYRVFEEHISKRIVFWNGSDVSRLLDNPRWIKIIQETKANHYCHNIQLQDELKSIGVDAKIVPLFFGYKKDFQLSYRKPENGVYKVFINANEGREEEYGIPKALELAKEFKDIEFHIYGIKGINKDNVIYHGWIPEEQMNNEMMHYHGCLRFNEHDGLSQVVIKASLLGLHTIVTPSLEKAREEIKNLNNPKPMSLENLEDLEWFKNIKYI